MALSGELHSAKKRFNMSAIPFPDKPASHIVLAIYVSGLTSAILILNDVTLLLRSCYKVHHKCGRKVISSHNNELIIIFVWK